MESLMATIMDATSLHACRKSANPAILQDVRTLTMQAEGSPHARTIIRSTQTNGATASSIEGSILSIAEIGGWLTTSTGITVPSNIVSKKSYTRLFIATMSTIWLLIEV
jgi:hypothetical protein